MEKYAELILWLKARIDEPSTHASLATVFLMLGQQTTGQFLYAMLNITALFFAFMGMYFKEKGKK